VNLAHHENDSGYSKADGSSVKERSEERRYVSHQCQ